MMIVDARAFHSIETSVDLAALLERARPKAISIKTEHDVRPSDPHAIAYVNLGRWVADCPARPCAHPLTGEHAAGAEYVAPNIVFMCQWCWNQDIEGRYRPVDFPADKTALEAELLRRVEPDTRNWLPGETLADLQIENIAHGVAS